MKYALLIILTVVFVFVLPGLLLGQPPSFPTPPPQAPIDGGLGVLAVAGGAYALNKLRNRKK